MSKHYIIYTCNILHIYYIIYRIVICDFVYVTESIPTEPKRKLKSR